MIKIKSVLKSTFRKLGYRIVPDNFDYPKDLRDSIDHPINAKYYARKSNFLLNVPPEKCVILWGYSCSTKVGNPFVDTVIDYCDNNHTEFKGSKMEKFYKSIQPVNVAELFNLEGELNTELVDVPAYAMVLPWKNMDMKTNKNFVEKYVRHENKARGRELSVSHGVQQFGPISKEKGDLEIKTLIKLTESIKQKGYSRSDNKNDDITAVVLVKDEDYKYMVHDGTHRAAALTALGYKFLTIRIEPSVIPAFIYRNEVKYWPQVNSGLYSREQALQIFDTIYMGCGLRAHNKEEDLLMD